MPCADPIPWLSTSLPSPSNILKRLALSRGQSPPQRCLGDCSSHPHTGPWATTARCQVQGYKSLCETASLSPSQVFPVGTPRQPPAHQCRLRLCFQGACAKTKPAGALCRGGLTSGCQDPSAQLLVGPGHCPLPWASMGLAQPSILQDGSLDQSWYLHLHPPRSPALLSTSPLSMDMCKSSPRPHIFLESCKSKNQLASMSGDYRDGPQERFGP